MRPRSADGAPSRPALTRDYTAAQVSLQLKVARRFYVEDVSKVEIGKEFGISRFQVARLLQAARESGLVRISIDDHGAVREDLARRLVDALDLRSAQVLGSARTATPPDVIRADLGELAAQELSRTLDADDVLGLPWSRSVSAMVAALTTLPPVDVVQLSGARWAPEDSTATADVVRDVAAIGGGRAYRFHAPFVATGTTAAESLRLDPAYLAAQQQMAAITVAVVGIGAFDPTLSTLHAAATAVEIAELRAGGAVGEISGVFIDAAGRAVDGSFPCRLITVSAAQLKAIPNVIGVCMGKERAEATAAACRGGFVDSLVVDVPLAHELLRDDYRASRG